VLGLEGFLKNKFVVPHLFKTTSMSLTYLIFIQTVYYQ